MQLEHLAIELRPRSPAEAVDLGCVLVRRFGARLLLSWLATALPIAAVVSVTLHAEPVWAFALVWWLKPLYERLPLWLLSRAIFGDAPRLRDAIRNWRAALMPDLLPVLTFRRLSPTRSFDAPIAVLEGLTGARRRERSMVLHHSASGAPFWLTVVGYHLEIFVASSVWILLALLVPAQVEIDWWAVLLATEQLGFAWASNFIVFLAFALVAPLYIACGFALYLNRRILLEGWDIELRFRELAARAQHAPRIVHGRHAAQVVAALLLVVCFGGTGVAWGDEPSGPAGESKAIIDEIVDAPPFTEHVTLRVPRLLRPLFEQHEEESRATDVEWLLAIAHAFAMLVEALLWLIAAAVLASIVYLAWRYGPWLERAKGTQGRPRPSLELFEEAAPGPAPIAAARAAWAEGEPRTALAILYRSAIDALAAERLLELHDGDTEGDCLRAVQRSASPHVSDFFARLTRAWQRTAYAHRIPTASEFDALCEAWCLPPAKSP